MTVDITQDGILESTESFLVLFNTTDPSVIISSGIATVMIMDEDSKSLH